MSSTDPLSGFDVNGPGLPGRLFGLPFTQENARVVVLPVPWEVTVSYRTGTALGPRAVLDASRQIDFFHREVSDAWKLGTCMAEIPESLHETNRQLRVLVDRLHEAPHEASVLLERTNEACGTMNIYVRNQASHLLTKGKIVGLLGGDHSTPLGLIRALAERHDRFGVLQIDAHADLRKAYEGFAYSHGSVMYNVLKIPSVKKLVQVGIRDFCEEEFQLIQRAGGRVRTFFDDQLRAQQDQGMLWSAQVKEIVDSLPDDVYISFDIDGLDPRYCPHTGTPVPGGLDFHQAVALIKAVAVSGRRIIGFDLNEVAPGPDDWDANVGARMLWQLSLWTGVSQKLLQYKPSGH
jgi:agmatinase